MSECTGLAATWCPVCGDCTCPIDANGERQDEVYGGNLGCPLHDPTSCHAEPVPRVDDDLQLVKTALLDHAPGPLPEHDPMCRTLSGWTDQRAKGCNCSVARNTAARDALERVAGRIGVRL